MNRAPLRRPPTSARVTVWLATATVLASIACHQPRRTEIGDGWFVDEGLPEKPAAHLYREKDGTRVVVDRQIDAYRLYARFCLVYETFRSNGRVVFAVAGGMTPIGIATSDEFNRWRIDTDGLRRFDTRTDTDGGRLLNIEWIDYSDFCYVAQTQPAFQEHWAQNARFDYERVHIQESVIGVNAKNSVGASTLDAAARKGQLVIVDELLRAGADVNSANDAGTTALMVAIVYNHLDVARRLIQGGARINAQDDRGATALMLTARYRRLEIAQLLLDAGADGRIHDDSGKTAAAWAPDGGHDTEQRLRTLLAAAAAAK